MKRKLHTNRGKEPFFDRNVGVALLALVLYSILAVALSIGLPKDEEYLRSQDERANRLLSEHWTKP